MIDREYSSHANQPAPPVNAFHPERVWGPSMCTWIHNGLCQRSASSNLYQPRPQNFINQNYEARMSLFWFGANDGFFGPPICHEKAMKHPAFDAANEIFHGGVTFNGCGRGISALSLKMHAGWCQRHIRRAPRVSSLFPRHRQRVLTRSPAAAGSIVFSNQIERNSREFYSLNLSLHDLISFPVVLPPLSTPKLAIQFGRIFQWFIEAPLRCVRECKFPSTMSFIQFLLLVPGPENDGNLLPESAWTCETSIFTVERGKNVERRLLLAGLLVSFTSVGTFSIVKEYEYCGGKSITIKKSLSFFCAERRRESACLRFDGNLRDAFGSICYTL